MRVSTAIFFAFIGVLCFGQTIVARPFVSGFKSPIQYAQNPQRPTYGYVLQRAGAIYLVIDGVRQSKVVLNLVGQVSLDGEGGLLGMTFDPSFATNRYVYFDITTNATTFTHILRYTMLADGRSIDPASKFNILTIAQPYTNHKGGTLHFGSDGYLYIGMGDGGSGNDPDKRAQDPKQLLGKFLRIDPSHDDFPTDPDRNYAIPTTNPFFGADSYGLLDEVWSIGVRNPFRWSFDSLTSAMVIGDVGQDAYEEVDYEPSGKGGRNYGWKVWEGRHLTHQPGSLLIAKMYLPFIEVAHPTFESLIGGFVYRGKDLGPEFYGRYFFGDASSSLIWSAPIQLDTNGEAKAADSFIIDHSSSINQSLPNALSEPVSLDPDANGEVVVTNLASGVLFKLAVASINFAPAAVKTEGGTNTGGDLDSLSTADSNSYSVASRLIAGLGQSAAFAVNFHLDRNSRQFHSLQANLALGVAANGTVDFYGFNWTTKKWVILTRFSTHDSITPHTVPISLGTAYFSSANTISLMVRGSVPQTFGTAPFTLRGDQFTLSATY